MPEPNGRPEMARTKAAKGKAERVTLRDALLAALNGKPVSAEDAAKRIKHAGRYKGLVSAGLVARCARWHKAVFAVTDGAITKRATK